MFRCCWIYPNLNGKKGFFFIGSLFGVWCLDDLSRETQSLTFNLWAPVKMSAFDLKLEKSLKSFLVFFLFCENRGAEDSVCIFEVLL